MIQKLIYVIKLQENDKYNSDTKNEKMCHRERDI